MVTKWFGGDQQSQHRVPSTLQGGWALGGLEGASMPCSSRGWTGPGICADPCGHRVPHPQAGLCSQCCQTAQSWGLLLVTLVPDKLLMRTGDAQIQFFCVGLSGCYSPSVSLLMSLLLPAFHVPSGLSWPAPVILGLLGPSSHASVAQEWQREQECLLLPLPFPKLIYPFTAPPGNSAQTQKHSQTHPHG